MNKEKNEELYNAILTQQGDLLYTTLAEECSELIQACSKIQRKKYYNADINPCLDNLFEEICDVELNLELIKRQILSEKNVKLTRQDVDFKIRQWQKIKDEKISKIFLK